MRKILLYAALVLTLSACGHPKGGNGGAAGREKAGREDITETDPHTEAYIRKRLDTIYQDIAKPTYDRDGNRTDYIQNAFNFDSAYCSQRYYALMQRAMEICHERGEILYDYDHWVCGQDYSDDWSMRVSDVYRITDTSALADLEIHNFGETRTTIALRFERGNWYIDDFSPSDDGEDDQSYLRQIIREAEE